MKKKLLALVLAAAMLTTLLTGCTDTTEGEDAGSQTAADAGTEAKDDSADKAAEGGTETEGEKSAAAGDAVNLDLYLNFSWFPTDSWTGIIPEELTKNGGVYFDVTRTADDSQLGLMIASGDLPDVIFTDSEIDRLCDSNLCWSYDELIETYGIDWEPSSDRIAIAKSHNANADDDHYYTIIQNYNSAEDWANANESIVTVACGYYRKDIWEAMGSPAMNTKEDVFNVLKMVKEQYPDMIPICGGNPYWRFGVMSVWFGTNVDYIFDDEGSIIFRDTSDNFYEYVKFVNQMYQEGLFPEENLAITNEDDAKQQAISGQCFMYEWNARPTQMAQLQTSTEENIPEAEWAPFVYVEGNEPELSINSGWAGVFISKNCKDPEAAIKMIAYMNSEEGQHLALWGREGIDWTMDESSGMPVFSDEWKETVKDSERMVSTYNNNYYMCTTELSEQYTYYAGLDQELLDAFAKNKPEKMIHPEISIAAPVSSSDEGVIRAKINEAREAELAKIYTAKTDEEFEAAYAEYMALLDKIGVQQLNEYMTNRVAEVKEDFGF